MRRLFGLVLGVLGVLLLTSPVWAMGNPDYVSIGDVYVFEDVVETGDQLFFCRYDVSYNGTPDEDAEDTWQMVLYNSTGSLIATRPLNYYQHNIISIYLTADEAIASGAAHRIKIMGMPSVFGNLTEDVTMQTRTLTSGDYIAGEFLGGYMVTQAEILETDWEIALLTSGDKLNDTGATYFLKAVPGLNTMVPEIFQVTTSGVVYEPTDWTENYTELTTTRTGWRLRNAINSTIGILGGNVSEAWAGAWMTGFAFIVLAAPVYASTRQPALALLVAFPVVLGAAWLGVGEGELLRGVLLIVLVLAVFFSITFILRYFG